VTRPAAVRADRPHVHVAAKNEYAQAQMSALIRTCGFPLAAQPDGSANVVVIATVPTVDEAMATWPLGPGPGGCWLLVAERFSPLGVRRAVRAGVHTMLRTSDATSEQLTAAVIAAHRDEGRIPHEVLIRLLGAARRPAASATPRTSGAAPSLTSRQRTVLALMAEGLGNADIARALRCSEHTVKNVIYDLTARLQSRNRAHAVACAVRRGLV
jgi:DNA-binding NarL/FixJ family response regulator